MLTFSVNYNFVAIRELEKIIIQHPLETTLQQIDNHPKEA